MKVVRKRKPRGYKQDGTKSYDFCTGCYRPFCDPFALSPAMNRKIDGRLEKGLCPACGKPWAYCSCHSKLKGGPALMTHNNKKEKRFLTRKNELVEQMNQIYYRLESLDDLSEDALSSFLDILWDLERFNPNRSHEHAIEQIKKQMKCRSILREDEIHVLGEVLSFYLYNGGASRN